MADIIARFKGDTSDLDTKIKKASQTLLQMKDDCDKVGGAFINLDKEQVDFIRSMGQMETGCKTAKGTISELQKAFTDLSAVYNRLSEEEKADEGGKALRSSLEQLKGRIHEGQQELKNINGEISSNGSALDQLAGKFGLNIKQLASWGAAIGAGKAAMDVLKDAFMSSESNVDLWGRTMESAATIYDSFVLSLESGNFSNFFSNLDNIIAKAKEAYNALDELGTRMTIINPERVKLQGQISKQKEIIRKEGKESAAGKKAQREIRRLEPQLKQTYYDESKMNYDAFEAKVREKLAEGGLNLDNNSFNFLMRSFSDSNVFKQLRNNAHTTSVGTGRFMLDENGHAIGQEITKEVKNTNQKLLDLFTDEWRRENSTLLTASYSAKNAAAMSGVQNARYLSTPTTGRTSTTHTPSGTPKIELTGPLIDLENELKELQVAQHQASSPEQWQEYEQKIISIQGQIDTFKGKVKEVKPPEWVAGVGYDASNAGISWLTGDIKGQLDNAEIGSELYNTLSAQLADVNSFKNIIEQWVSSGLELADFSSAVGGVDNIWQQLFDGANIPDETWQSLVEQINEKLQSLDIEPIKLDFKTGNINEIKEDGKQTEQSFKGAATAISSVASALGQLEDPGAKVAGIIGEAIANIALGFSIATSKDGAGGTFAWIAAITGGLATMVSTIAAIKSATAGSYAEGGIVPGNSYSGDRLTANVNSGELILNRAQQDSVASQLQGSGIGNLQLSTAISAEDLVILLDNNARRRHRGEYVRSKQIAS